VGVKDRSCDFTIPPPPLTPPTPGRGRKKNGRGGEEKRRSHAGEGNELATLRVRVKGAWSARLSRPQPEKLLSQ